MRFFFIITLIIVITTVSFSFNLIAQSKKPIRAEIETDENSKPFNIVNLGENGVLIISQLNEFIDRKTQNWSLTYFNNILQKKWTKKIPLNEDLSYQGFDFEKDSVYLFFHKENKKSSENNLSIISTEYIKGSTSISNLVITEKSRLTTLRIFNHKAYFTSEGKNDIFLNIYDIAIRKNNEIKINNSDDINIESMLIDTIKNELYILFKNEISKKENTLNLKKYSLEGKELKSMNLINSDESNKILTGSINLLKDGNIAITGSYNLTSEKATTYSETSVMEAAGMYYVKIENNTNKAFQFYNFLTFKEIEKYLNKKEISKIRKIKENKEQKEFSLNYMLIEHEMIQNNGKIIMVAEAFYPEYHTISDMSYDTYGRMIPTSRTVFDGYRYTNAFILCLDEDGKIIWNQLFDIWNILSMDIKERVSIMSLKDDYIFCYNNEGELVYKAINDTTIISEIENTKIELSYSNDKTMQDLSSNIDYWYSNYYLTYGIQTIKNNALANKSKRTIFYLNKISYE